MGCLVEVLGELFVEIVLGGLFYIYSGLMSLVVPHRKLSTTAEKRIRKIIKVITALFLLALLIGCSLLLADSPAVVIAGKIIVISVASVSALQIFLGVAVVISKKKKNKWKRR